MSDQRFPNQPSRGAAAAQAVASPVKAFTDSTTTQNVAGGVVLSGGTLAGVFGFVRSAWPTALPWDASADPAIVTVLTAVLGPLLSRAIAWWREPHKANQ